MIEINESNIDDTLVSDQLVMIDFWAEWCGPCKMLTPIVEELATEYKDKAVITKCNVDTNPNIATKYAIRNIPTVLFLRNGEVIDKIIGVQPKLTFEEKLNALQ
jgi:thioredoxin 1